MWIWSGRSWWCATAKETGARRIPVPEAVWTVLLAYLAERKGRRGALLRTWDKRVRIRAHGRV